MNVLLGGEPLLREDIGEMVEYMNKIDLPYNIITNAMLTDKKFDILKRVKGIEVSVQSLSPADERSRAGIRTLIKLRPYVKDMHANIVVTPGNIGEVIPIVTYLNRMDVAITITVGHSYRKQDKTPWLFRGIYRNFTWKDFPALRKLSDKLIEIKRLNPRSMLSPIEFLYNLPYASIDNNRWHCENPHFMTVDEDCHIIACMDFRGARVNKWTVPDLRSPAIMNRFVKAYQLDVDKCPGCSHTYAVVSDLAAKLPAIEQECFDDMYVRE
jgi:sulfatase maturation enzyme AslB (radical SAM superfamily)